MNETYLAHHGVLGMKWGQHKAKRAAKRAQYKSDKKAYKRIVRKKRRRKLLTAVALIGGARYLSKHPDTRKKVFSAAGQAASSGYSTFSKASGKLQKAAAKHRNSKTNSENFGEDVVFNKKTGETVKGAAATKIIE